MLQEPQTPCNRARQGKCDNNVLVINNNYVIVNHVITKLLYNQPESRDDGDGGYTCMCKYDDSYDDKGNQQMVASLHFYYYYYLL